MEKITERRGWYLNDAAFDWLYPERIQQLSRQHWTPLSIARRAAQFLVSGNGTRILDIGSGVGKFCLTAAHYFPEASFCGIEQRRELYHFAMAAREATGAQNVDFIHGNFTQIDLEEYDHFYFYNAFFENLASEGHIDKQIAYSTSLYTYYSRYLSRALDNKPSGTRLVTFHSLEDEVPPSYQLVDASVDFMLKMWIKR
ncbi:MAG TPA: class I SAM-dependent methyltransferase [Chitinophaga sp.]|uniref:class I SAM-dependent methyltransferase n=1 Tax=Chitinophaga sp. TaxID=1869181 RepID=UPI002C9430BA|nr:class I SAM-dependent methyltransferase [Chitinophaga sp.]HVI48938.1 class I SAM-dependent methyltransferase [Chitinophaga sp.]